MDYQDCKQVFSQGSSGFNLDVLAIVISVLTLLFVVDEYFNRKRTFYKEKISEFYASAYEYVRFQEESFKNERVFDNGTRASHTTTGWFSNFNGCGTELLNRRDALLDLIFKKASYVSAEVLQLAFSYEKSIHAEGLPFNDKALINQKLELCELIKKDYFEYKEKGERWIIFR
jgi:hypothetical protein